MKKQVLMGVFALSTFLGLAPPLHAQLIQEGDWVGRVIHLTGRHMDVVYKVRSAGGEVGIDMEVEGYGSFEFRDIRLSLDSLSFTWSPSFDLNCAMYLLDDGVYQGACKDPWGGFGGIFMAPPGSDVNAIVLDEETIESIAGWEPPEEGEELASLGEDYPVGKRVDIGGYRLNMIDAGTGDVTVVLEAGLGDNLTTWDYVQRKLALTTRVVAYDRAGLGYSESSRSRRSPEQIATELHALLREAEIPPPYVLVGHAEGSLHVRRFASLYPKEVAGLVLVDPSHEAQAVRWRALSASSWDEYLAKKIAFNKMMPEPLQAEYNAFVKVLEQESVPGLGPLPDVPTVVLTAARPAEEPRWIGETPEGRAAWRAMHKQWVDQAENATHLVTETSGPYIHHEDPVLVLRAIAQVMEAVQRGK